jgi:hypothetical protein
MKSKYNAPTNTLRQRCGYSCIWKNEISPNAKKDRIGFVVGETKDGECYYVLWNGRKSPETIHKTYIEIIVYP